MNNLVIMHDQQAVTTSLILAEAFEKEHRNVIRTIETKIGELNFEQSLKMFSKGEYTNTQNKTTTNVLSQSWWIYVYRNGFYRA